MKERRCPIVGIGASAGSLDPLKKLLSAIPVDSGAAFVLIQHLDPNYQSLIAEILGRATGMPVVQAEDGMAVEPNHVYVIPPGTDLSVRENTLRVSKPVLQHGVRMPIDSFLWSLAEELSDWAVALILSGANSDGTLGLRAIKGNGGMVLVQAPETAQYDSMPRSAIETGLADFVGSVEEMPDVLIRYLQHPYIRQENAPSPKTAEPVGTDETRSALSVLQARTGYDFSAYKQGTIFRRIARRMGLRHIEDKESYLNVLRTDSKEAPQLVKDLLIGVTSFFRDPDAFEVLDAQAIADIVKRKNNNDPIRVWVPGCATGEEAYSIAILLTEQLEAAQKRCPISIFATDLDEDSLSVGRAGRYPENIAATISASRLRRFFDRDGHYFLVNKSLRETVTFATQNLIYDPPFSRVDLISCRNLLIYLNQDVQQRILGLFHFALRPDGYLFLGHSETTGQMASFFKPVAKKWRLYRRANGTQPVRIDFPGRSAPMRAPVRQEPVPAGAKQPHRLGDLARQVLLAEYAPAAIVVNQASQVVHYYGPTGRYLDMPTGEPTQDVFQLVRPELRSKMRVALRRAYSVAEPVSIDDARINRNGASVPVRIVIRSLPQRRDAESLFLVTFADLPEDSTAPTPAEEIREEASDTDLVRQLEYELGVTRAELQGNIEEHESANEELQAANEEVMSVNEELQSANEELETSKEELQSMNEELSTVNSQLKEKVDELATTNDDLVNFLNSTEIPTLFLDREMKIGRYTPATTRLMNLITTDKGRPLADISNKIHGINLPEAARDVLHSLVPSEHEVTADDGASYFCRILPYRTEDNRIGGVVVTFVDITERKRSEEQTRLLAAIVRDSNDAILLLDPEGTILAWNRGAERIYGWTEREAVQKSINTIFPEPENEDAQAYMSSLLAGDKSETFETRRKTKDGRILDVWAAVTPLRDEGGSITAIAATERDLTPIKLTTAKLQESEKRARAYLDSIPDAILIHGDAGKFVHVNAMAERLFGYSQTEMKAMSIESLMPERYRTRHVAHRAAYSTERIPRSMGNGMPLFGLAKDGREFPIDVGLSPIGNGDTGLTIAIVRDITERLKIEEDLRQAKAAAEHANATKSRFLATASHDLRQPLQSLILLNSALEKTVADQDAQKLLGMQKSSVNAMKNLLDKLLDIGKLETGGGTPTLSDVSLQPLFDQLRDEFTAHARDKKLELRFEATDEICRTDPDFLADMLRNLIANAIRYTEKGFVQLRCIAESDKIQLEVSDTGIGIPKDQLSMIFDEFHQVKRDTKLPKMGLGLGLAIVRRLARLLDTEIAVQSELGKGSTFSFLLPRGIVQPAMIKQHIAESDLKERDTITVLLVDDDISVLEATRIFLETEGFRVIAASSAQEAYEVIKTAAGLPDIIITDYVLNEKESGLNLFRKYDQGSNVQFPP